MRKSALFLLLFCGVISYGECPVPKPTPYLLELGITGTNILPNSLPDFKTSIPVYGPTLGVRVFNDIVELHADYGTNANLSVYSVDLSYRYQVDTPFLKGFLSVGANFMTYSTGTAYHPSLGPEVGAGALLTVSPGVQAIFFHKIYFHNTSVVLFGAGFNYLL